ncbi:deaminase [Pseudomonas phage 98PfluR60PP]|uniref:Deaminase n=1 Tax=Pseudomonas phage 98PfluR60PP TaxID=2163965 RepID=A0A2S1PFU9_9CAUD|nr:dCMP deaminase [Pseudomonas phage 98PfluR60PP]AWH15449.1 deaminase [Pseudomonas phage 98PfluR60PP]
MLKPLKEKYWPMYMNMAYAAEAQTAARREQVGCVIVTQTGLILPGYNGQPAGHHTNCCENTPVFEIDGGGKKVQRMKTDPTVIHAEDNALRKAKLSEVDLEGAHLFVTVSPCPGCCALIVDSGIEAVHYHRHHDDMSGFEILDKAGIAIIPS